MVAWEVLNFGVLKIHPLKKWHSLLVKLKQHTEPPPTSLFLTMGCNSSKNLCTTTTVTHQTESVASAESTPIPSTNKVDLATMPTEPGEDACVDNVITSDIKVQDENPASYNDNANTLQNDKHQIELSEYIIANANDHHAATLEVPTTRSSDNTCAKIVSVAPVPHSWALLYQDLLYQRCHHWKICREISLLFRLPNNSTRRCSKVGHLQIASRASRLSSCVHSFSRHLSRLLLKGCY